MHGRGRRLRDRELLVSRVDDSFNFGGRAGRRGGLDPRALAHALLASGCVIVIYLLLRLV